MLSLNSVLLVLMLLAAAIASTCAWYQWSPQVIQLNVPVGAAVGAADGAAPAADGAPAGADAAAGGVDRALEQAARNPPAPIATPAAPVTFRNWRRLYSRIIRSSMERSSILRLSVVVQSAMIAASSAGHHTHTSSPSSPVR